MSDIGQQGSDPEIRLPGGIFGAGAWWLARSGVAKALMAASLALGAGLGTFAMAYAASARSLGKPGTVSQPERDHPQLSEHVVSLD